jgi:hypothetical protein
MDNESNVVGLFSGKTQPSAPKPTIVPTTEMPPDIDFASIAVLEGVIAELKSGAISGCCVMGRAKTDLPRIFLQFSPGSRPQAEALRYIGFANIMTDLLNQIVYHGIQTEDDEAKR